MAGVEGSVVINKVKEGNGAFGYNARTNVYEDLIEAGVIDPKKWCGSLCRTPHPWHRSCSPLKP